MLRFKVLIDAPVEALQYVERELSDLREFYENKLHPKMMRDIDTIFDREGRPKWAPLNEKYERWKKRYYPTAPILELSGELRDAYTIWNHPAHKLRITAKTISLSVDIEYAPLHESGTKTRTHNMPARPVVGSLSKDHALKNQYNKQFRRHIISILKKAGVTGKKVGVETHVPSRSRMQTRRARQRFGVSSVSPF